MMSQIGSTSRVTRRPKKPKPFVDASPEGVSVVAYRQHVERLPAFLSVQQAFCRTWDVRKLAKRHAKKYGAFCAPTTRRRARVFFDSPDYHFYVGCVDGQPEMYADVCLALPLFPDWEQEMWEEVEAQGGTPGTFFDRWNAGVFNFNVVAYVYYVLKSSMSAQARSMYALWKRVLGDMQARGVHCFMTDLPIKVAGVKSADLPRITEMAIAFGFKPTAIFVFDTDGNVWQQYCYILNGRPVTVADKLRAAGLGMSDLPKSYLWQEICKVNNWDQASSRERLAEFMKSATSASSFFDALVGVAA